eukprot:SAG31_NODE_1284_length_9010_cov_56.116934_7_plen_153_part_00
MPCSYVCALLEWVCWCRLVAILNGSEREGPKKKVLNDLLNDEQISQDATVMARLQKVLRICEGLSSLPLAFSSDATNYENAEAEEAKTDKPISPEDRHFYLYVAGGHSDPNVPMHINPPSHATSTIKSKPWIPNSKYLCSTLTQSKRWIHGQ